MCLLHWNLLPFGQIVQSLIIHQLLQPLTTNCKTRLSITRSVRSPLSPINWASQGREENGWVVGLGDVRYAYSAHCTFSSSLCLSVMPRYTQCGQSIFIWKVGTDLKLPKHTLKGDKPHSKPGQSITASGRTLLFQIRWVMTLSRHTWLDRWVKLLSMQVASGSAIAPVL